MEGIGKNMKEEFRKRMISGTPLPQGFEARLREEAKDHAIHFKIDTRSELHPCLNLGADDRNLGVVAKSEQTPVTKTEHKMEMDTDSVSTEKEKPTHQLKTE